MPGYRYGRVAKRRGAVACAADEGFLPWADLGAASVDAWGRLYRYRVTAAFARDGLSLSDTGDIMITAGVLP
ncbi:MAG: hypothetical protein GKR94_33160 [Gammaproteobacteria bacterium]|nr:hypothetical protein [Gammaproteobacteria bacterium]